jgi:hypothetical protein
VLVLFLLLFFFQSSIIRVHGNKVLPTAKQAHMPISSNRLLDGCFDGISEYPKEKPKNLCLANLMGYQGV